MLSTKIHKKVMVSLCLLLMTFDAASLRAASEADITIPFELVNGLIILQAEIDGVQGAYLLDTGADAILIDGEPKKADQVIATPTGDVPIASHQIALLKIGSFIQHEISAKIISLSSLKEQLGIDLHGIIGGGYFMPNTLIMNFADSTITISPEKADNQSVKDLTAIPFEMVNQIPIVEVEIEGKLHTFAMDSGATVHFIDHKVLDALSTISEMKTTSTVLTVDKSSENTKRYVLNKFTIGNTSFSGHHCLSQGFDNINSELGQSISGILSLSQLAQNKVVLDFKNNMLYL